MNIREEMRSRAIEPEVISAARYYVGTPDGNFFKSGEFCDEIVNAPKAYITINTIIGEEGTEESRFKEGKKQIPDFFTKKGIEKIVQLYKVLFHYGLRNKVRTQFTTQACRRTKEIETGMLQAFSSTTKNSIEEIMKLGYGDKINLAICKYIIEKGAVVFDMEMLGEEYKKPEEREVLLLMGNRLESKKMGVSKYTGKDGKKASIFQIRVNAPKFEDICKSDEEIENLKSIIYDDNILKEIKAFFERLNETEKTFPEIPENYIQWKKSFKKYVYTELNKIMENGTVLFSKGG